MAAAPCSEHAFVTYDGSVSADPPPLSALPSRAARALAFAGIVVAGVAGALIGWAFVDVQCTGRCATPTTIGAVVGGLAGALGTAVVAVLVLRAMGEWRELGDRRAVGGAGDADATRPSTGGPDR